MERRTYAGGSTHHHHSVHLFAFGIHNLWHGDGGTGLYALTNDGDSLFDVRASSAVLGNRAFVPHLLLQVHVKVVYCTPCERVLGHTKGELVLREAQTASVLREVDECANTQLPAAGHPQRCAGTPDGAVAVALTHHLRENQKWARALGCLKRCVSARTKETNQTKLTNQQASKQAGKQTYVDDGCRRGGHQETHGQVVT